MKEITSSAHWKGGLKEGSGEMNVGQDKKNKFNYTAGSRFEDSEGSNPEELLGAAHAGCFSMDFSARLEKKGYSPEEVHTDAKVTLEKEEHGFRITKVDLTTRARVKDIDKAEFQDIAETTKDNCPVSKLFTGAEISVSAELEEEPVHH